MNNNIARIHGDVDRGNKVLSLYNIHFPVAPLDAFSRHDNRSESHILNRLNFTRIVKFLLR